MIVVLFQKVLLDFFGSCKIYLVSRISMMIDVVYVLKKIVFQKVFYFSTMMKVVYLLKFY